MNTRSLVGTAFFIALGVILPQIFHIFGSGSMLLPMHIPVLLCGFCYGPLAGFVCGVVTPFLSSIATGMPPLFPVCVTMIFELSTYGFTAGYFYQKLNLNIYLALIGAMLCGRIVGGLSSIIIYQLMGTPMTYQILLNSYLITGLPGIILQIIVVPIIVVVLKKSRVLIQKH